MIEQLRNRIKEAMKNKSPEKDILRVFLGKLQQIEADEGPTKLTNDRCYSVARTIIKGNKEAVSILEAEKKTIPQEWREKLEAENKVMESFLPTYLDKDEVIGLLATHDIIKDIVASKNDGAATGIAMKFLKGKNLPVEGETVQEIVKSIRKE